jgi:hypothetical protein
MVVFTTAAVVVDVGRGAADVVVVVVATDRDDIRGRGVVVLLWRGVW